MNGGVDVVATCNWIGGFFWLKKDHTTRVQDGAALARARLRDAGVIQTGSKWPQGNRLSAASLLLAQGGRNISTHTDKVDVHIIIKEGTS